MTKLTLDDLEYMISAEVEKIQNAIDLIEDLACDQKLNAPASTEAAEQVIKSGLTMLFLLMCVES